MQKQHLHLNPPLPKLTYPTETTQQVNQTNHVDPPIKAEQPKRVNDLNQHQAEIHGALDRY